MDKVIKRVINQVVCGCCGHVLEEEITVLNRRTVKANLPVNPKNLNFDSGEESVMHLMPKKKNSNIGKWMW